MSDAILSPLFQIFGGLSFAVILAVRFMAPAALKPLWGKVAGFALIFIALGNLLLSFAARGTLSRNAELFALGGASFFVAAILIFVALLLAARQTVVTK
jgi:hypothetical protein